MKKMISIALVGLGMIFSPPVFATGDLTTALSAKACITGKVVDIKTGELLVGVAVSVVGTNLKVYTDLDGTFTINTIEPGNYNLILSLISYKNSLVENLKLDPSEKETIDIKLDVIR